MAYPKTRSVCADLAYGISEGSYNMPGKDWGQNHPDIVLPDRVTGPTEDVHSVD